MLENGRPGYKKQDEGYRQVISRYKSMYTNRNKSHRVAVSAGPSTKDQGVIYERGKTVLSPARACALSHSRI
jgi:hypothetical protein